MPEHTPRPWIVQYGGQPDDAGFTIMARAGGGVVAECWPAAPTEEERRTISANALHIVRCVNAHDDLLEACLAIVRAPDRQMGPTVQRAAQKCLDAIAKATPFDPLDAALDATDGDLDQLEPND